MHTVAVQLGQILLFVHARELGFVPSRVVLHLGRIDQANAFLQRILAIKVERESQQTDAGL